MGSPARRIAWRRTSCRGYWPVIPLKIFRYRADRTIADAFGYVSSSGIIGGGVLTHGKGRGSAVPEWDPIVLSRIRRLQRRSDYALVGASASHQHTFAMESPPSRFAWRRASCRWCCLAAQSRSFRNRG
jgi:hypothetical protein